MGDLTEYPAEVIRAHSSPCGQVTQIPEDVKEKLLRFGRAAVAVATMRGKSYLQIGSQCMGIAGSFQGQRQWTDHWLNCDYPEALLSSTFDYEGAREPYTLATEAVSPVTTPPRPKCPVP